jgi:hypothetical protein
MYRRFAVNHRRTTPFFVPYFETTPHAEQRMAQRNLSDESIRFVLQYGQRYYKEGIIQVFLGTRDIPNDFRKQYGRLEGTVVLVSPSSTIITVYRNRKGGVQNIRRKKKQARKAERRQPLYPIYLQ